MLQKRCFFFLLSGLLVFAACKKVDIQFGEQYLDNGATQIIKVDTFSAQLSTVYVDSFITSGGSVSMIGGYTDPYFGKINTQCFLELEPPSHLDSYNNAAFDSLVVMLKPDKSYYGDTSRSLHIDVNRLAEPIIIPNEGSVLYNTQQFAVTATPAGSADISVRPHVTDSFTIRLNDNLGRELLKKLQNPNDADIQSKDAFLQYFYGLRLSAPAGSALALSCKDSIVMRLFYTTPGLYQQHNSADFKLTNSNHHFNHITVNRSATPLSNIGPLLNEIPSSQTGNAAFSQYTSGVMAKIRFPSLRDILKFPNYVKILKASLVLKPVGASYDPFYYLPPELRLSSTTQLNQIGPDLAEAGASGTAVSQTGHPVTDYLYGENTNYTYDITGYLKAAVTASTDNRNGLLVIPPSPALQTIFSRVVLGDKANKNGQVQLVIFYAAVQ